ncbi:hypothetical protein PM082_006191 [Marasmius tenuissimus]|nr:hypothetical protein PM082_006191 [Marasmius tenuissimus]
MSHKHSLVYSAKIGQRGIDGSALRIGRDQNVNNGSGSITVDNRIIQQTIVRRINWYIQGTVEEEEEYEQYGEYKRSDIRMYQEIHRERVNIYDRMADEFALIDCERSIFLGEIVSGDGIGNIVTVEAYGKRDAPKRWKRSFASYSGRLCVNNAHLVALNRSKVSLLIFSGGLVPIAHLTSLGWLAGVYFDNLLVSSLNT